MPKRIDSRGVLSKDALFEALMTMGLALAIVTIGVVLSHDAPSGLTIVATLAGAVAVIASPLAFARLGRSALEGRPPLATRAFACGSSTMRCVSFFSSHFVVDATPTSRRRVFR